MNDKNEKNDFLSRVLNDGKDDGGFEVGGLGRDFGYREDEILVGVMGTDLFVVENVGNERNENGGVEGDFVQGEVSVEDYGVTDDVIFLENSGDEGTGSGEMCCGNASGLDGRGRGDGLERRDEVLGNGDVACELSTPSAHECSGMCDEVSGSGDVGCVLSTSNAQECSGMRDEVMGGDVCCGSGDGLERRDEVLGSGDMGCALSTMFAHECSGLRDEVTGGDMCCGNGGGLGGGDEVKSGDVCCGNGDGLERHDEVLGRGDMGCALSTPSAHECSGLHDEGFSCGSEVSAGDSVVATGLSSGETEVVGEKMKCSFNDDTAERMVENSDVLVSQIGFLGDANAESGFRSYSFIAKADEISEQVSEEVKVRGVNGKDQVVHSIVVDAESPCLETVQSISVKRAYVETDTGTTCVNAEPVDHQTEAVEGLNEMLNKKEETWQLGPKIIESDVHDGKCLAGVGLVKNNPVTESSGDHVNVSVDSISSQNPAKLVDDSQVADDDDKVSNKGIETSKGVDFSEAKGDCGEGTRTSSDSVSTIEHTQVVAGYNEAFVNKVSTVNDIEMTTNDSFLQNPMSEVSEIKAVQCEPKYTDARKDCKQALISEMNYEEATDYKGSEADASGVSLSVCGGDNNSVEAILKRTEVLDLKEDPTAGVCCNSGFAKEVQNRKCDPVAGRNDLPSLEEGSQRQGLVSETVLVEHMKVVEIFGNDVAKEQYDIGIVSEGILEASLETISDEKLDSNSKPRVVDGDMNLVKDTNLSGLNSRGSGEVNEEKNDEMLKPYVKGRGLLGSEDDKNNILNQTITGEILHEGDSDSAIPHRVSEVTAGSEAVLSSDMLHRDGKAVHYFANDVPSHLPDCNWNSVNLMSDGITSYELLHLMFQKGNNEPVMGSLVDHMSTLCNEEEKKVQGSHLDRNVTLSYELNCVDSNVQGIEKDNDLQDSECLAASSTGNHTGVSSDQDHILEVNYDEEQVDVRTDQEMKTGCVDESTSSSCFEPGELLKHIGSLALLPSVGCDGQLQLTQSKAQVAAYSHFNRQHLLPEFHLCYGLLESDANDSRLSDVIQEHNDVAGSLPPRKKGRSISELMGEIPKLDGEEEHELDIRYSSVTASASRKRKAFESLLNSSGKRQVYYSAKVSSTAVQEPKKSFNVKECLSQLRLAAQDPVGRYSFLNEITSFFSGFRQSVISQYGEATSQLVPSEADKPVKSGQRSRKRFSSGKQVMVAEEPVADHMDIRRLDCSPTGLILKFTEGKSVPSELTLNKIFRRFGPLREHETEIDRESSSAKVVYKRCSDAKVAFSSAGVFNIFGPILVSYELCYSRSAPFKTLPDATVQDQEDAN